MNILRLLDRPITFHPVLVDLTGTINAALMLSNAVYWSNHLPSERDGWFHKSKEEWQCETRLTRHEQDAARVVLEQLGFLETRRAKLPNSEKSGLWFRVHAETLASALENFFQNRAPTPPTTALDPPKSRNPAFTPKAEIRTHKSRNSAFGLSLKKEHRLHIKTPPPPPPACVRVAMDMPNPPQPMTGGWEPSLSAQSVLQDAGIDSALIAELLPEFRLFWQESAVTRNNWNSVFIRHARKEFAYRNAQEELQHDRSTTRCGVSARPAPGRRETLAERNARYERFAAAGTEQRDASERPENAFSAIF